LHLLPRLTLSAILFSVLATSVGCPPPAQPSNGGHVSVDRTIGESEEAGDADTVRSDDQDANQSFEAAVQQWEQGDYRQAVESFRMFLVDYPDDPLSPRAEAYLGRSLTALDEFANARSVFESLASRSETAAQQLGELYLAFADELEFGRRRGVATLRQRLDNGEEFRVPAMLAVEGDAPLLGILSYHALREESRPVDAMRALSTIHATSEDDALKEWAVGAASSLANQAMNGQQLVDCLSMQQTEFSAVHDLGIAICAARLVEKYIAADDRESASIAMERGGQAMMRAGLEALFAQSNRLLSESGEDQSLRYAIILSLTGPDQRAGRAALGGVLLASRAFEQTESISELIIEDTGGSADGASQATERAISRGAKLIIGPLEPELAHQVREVSQSQGVPFISLATSFGEDGTTLERASETWELGFNPAAEADTIVAALANRSPAGGVTVIESGLNLPYLSAFAHATREALNSRGMTVLSTHSLVGEDSVQDAAERVARQVARERPNAIVFATTASETATLTAWLADNGVWPAGTSRSGGQRTLFLANSFAWGEELLRNSQRYVQGMFVPVWFDAALPGDRSSRFLEAFERTFGRAPAAVEAFAFDAASVARALLIEEGLRSADRLKERLAENVTFEGVTGTLAFGNPQVPVVTPRLMRIQDAQLRQVEGGE
jgi:ABC-type branched-subunit amino acid transport system substrate-binding protein